MRLSGGGYFNLCYVLDLMNLLPVLMVFLHFPACVSSELALGNVADTLSMYYEANVDQ